MGKKQGSTYRQLLEWQVEKLRKRSIFNITEHNLCLLCTRIYHFSNHQFLLNLYNQNCTNKLIVGVWQSSNAAITKPHELLENKRQVVNKSELKRNPFTIKSIYNLQLSDRNLNNFFRVNSSALTLAKLLRDSDELTTYDGLNHVNNCFDNPSEKVYSSELLQLTTTCSSR